jgi:hypothetical protein
MTGDGAEGKGEGELVLYRTEDGRDETQLRVTDGSVSLTQAGIGALFKTTPQNITLHLKSFFAGGELSEEATCKQELQVRQEGGRFVSRLAKLEAEARRLKPPDKKRKKGGHGG